MIASLRKAFRVYGKQPFNFVWGTLVYLLLQFMFLLGAVGLFVIYFFIASMFGAQVTPTDRVTLVIGGIIGLVLIFFMCGLNAGLIRSYSRALEGLKTSLREFFEYSLRRSALMFVIVLAMYLFTALAVVPVWYVWENFLKDIVYTEVLMAMYALFATFAIHMVFSGPMISAGALGTSLFQSMKNGFRMLRRKHIFFISLYALFAIVWLLNFIPFVQLITLFAIYPVVYSALIVMLQSHNETQGGF